MKFRDIEPRMKMANQDRLEDIIGDIFLKTFQKLHPKDVVLTSKEIQDAFYTILADMKQNTPKIIEFIGDIREMTANIIVKHFSLDQLEALPIIYDEINDAREVLETCSLDFSQIENLEKDVEKKLREREKEIKKYVDNELWFAWLKLFTAYNFHKGIITMPDQ